MKYKILICTTAIVVFIFLTSGIDSAFGNSGGSLPAFCGAPSDGTTCSQTGCHSGSPVTAVSGWISSNIPVSGYTPGVTYTITATASYTGINKFGFEISAQDASGNVKGSLINTNTDTQILSGSKYITHTSAGTIGNDTRTWTFNWKAPVSGSGQLSFYGAFVCADGNGLSTNDLVYTSVLTVDEEPTNGLDAGINAVAYPSVFACDSVISPQLSLQNYGTTVLTSAQISYQIDAGSPNSYTWNGSLATGAKANISLPSILIPSAGTHTFTATSSNPNGGTDVFTVNDNLNKIFTADFTPLNLPVIEGFENSTFPPAGWKIQNPDNNLTWARSTYSKHSGTGSAYVHNYGYHSLGQKDELISPSIDLTNSVAPVLHFFMAYRQYGDTVTNAISDTFDVFISDDCGANWISVYHNFGFPMTTIVPEFNILQFNPDTIPWRQESILLADYSQSNQVLVKFVNTTHYGNELYLDDISIGDPNGINLLTSDNSYAVFPNPSNGNFTVQWNLTTNQNPVQIEILNMQGKLIFNREYNSASGTFPIDLSAESKGIYLVRFHSGTETVCKKIVVE